MAEPMLAIARLRCPEAEFHSGDAEHRPFEEGRVDTVTCTFGILHFSEPERAIAEVYRVLKPGGAMRSRVGARRRAIRFLA